MNIKELIKILEENPNATQLSFEVLDWGKDGELYGFTMQALLSDQFPNDFNVITFDDGTVGISLKLDRSGEDDT